MLSGIAPSAGAGAVQASRAVGAIATPPQDLVRSGPVAGQELPAEEPAEAVREVTVQAFDTTFRIFKRLCLEPAEKRQRFRHPDWREISAPGSAFDRQIELESSRAWDGIEDGTRFAVVHATGAGAKGSVHARAQVRTCQVIAVDAPDPAFVKARLEKQLKIQPSGTLSEKHDNWQIDVWATLRDGGARSIDFVKTRAGLIVTEPSFYNRGREYIVVQFDRGTANKGVHSIRIAVYF